jgi:hypothetical protein
MYDVCKKCIHFIIGVDSKYCEKCGRDYPYHEVINENWKDQYKKEEYEFSYQKCHDIEKYNDSLIYSMKNRILGLKQKFYIPDLIKILKEIPEPTTWKNIWSVYRNHGYGEIWRGFYYTITGEKELPGPSYSDRVWIIKAMKALPKLHKYYKWEGTTKISFFYMLYKRMDARGEPVFWIPLKTTPLKLKEYESKYKDVCKYFKEEFKPIRIYTITEVTKNGIERDKHIWGIPPFKWNKYETIKKIHQNYSNLIRYYKWNSVIRYPSPEPLVD